MAYILVYLLLLVLALLEPYTKESHRKMLSFLSVLIVVCFQGLRWKTGTDWTSFYEAFIHSTDSDFIETFGFEVGYSWLNTAICIFVKSFTVFLLVECLLISLFQINALKRLQINNVPFFILMSFLSTIFPVRQDLAVAIVFLSYVFILEKKLLPYILCVLLAMSIHRSAILFVPAYFVGRIDLSMKNAVLAYLGSFLLGLFSEYVFERSLQMASMIYMYMGDAYQGKLEAYMTGEINEYAEKSPLQVGMAVANALLFIVLFCYFKKKYFIQNRIYSIFLTLYVFGICWNRVFMNTMPDFTRITAFYACGFNVMLIMIISKFDKKKQTWLFCLLSVYCFVKYWLQIHGYYESLYIPYFSIFSEGERLGSII